MECSNPLCSWLALWAKSNGRSQGTCGGQDGGCARHVDVCHQPLHGLHSFRTLATVKLLGCACFGENRYKAARKQWSGIFFLNGKIGDILRINASIHRYVFCCFVFPAKANNSNTPLTLACSLLAPFFFSPNYLMLLPSFFSTVINLFFVLPALFTR